MQKFLVLFSLSVISLLFALSGNVSAQTSATQTRPAQAQTMPLRQTQTTTTTQGNTLKDRALREIDRRVTSLTNAIERINGVERLDAATKQEMVTLIQAEIDSLTELRTKIETETDQTVIREDAESIVTSYRIYALFMPQVAVLSAAEGMLDVSEKMTEVKGRLLTEVTSASLSEDQAATLEQLLTDAEESITEAEEAAQTAIDTVKTLAPEGYPGNKTQIQTARQSLRTGRLSLVSARDNLRTVMTELGETQQPDTAQSTNPATEGNAMSEEKNTMIAPATSNTRPLQTQKATTTVSSAPVSPTSPAAN